MSTPKQGKHPTGDVATGNATTQLLNNWELVIGIEVHVQLRTATKIFCSCRTAFGSNPNENTCPVCLGLPGALPVLNERAVQLAVRAALALGCEIQTTSVFARKHYFYPDLPKGYQISQFEKPLALAGGITIPSTLGGETRVGIIRVHMEEDAGKSVHDRYDGYTAVDLNRAGTPLIEIVSAPDIRSAGDAVRYLRTLKQIMEYTDVSDANMEEGSLRADINISVRPHGSDTLGVKTEIKNLNTFTGIERAIEAEYTRHCAALEAGHTIEQQTMLWDAARNEVRPARSKEESHDYRYLPDPDLPPLVVTATQVEDERERLPELPDKRRARLREQLQLSAAEAEQVTATMAFADYTESTAGFASDGKRTVNWMLGAVTASLNARGISISDYVLTPAQLAGLIRLEASGKISNAAAKMLLPLLEESPTADCGELAAQQGLLKVSDTAQIELWVETVLQENPAEAERFLAGERKLQGVLVGMVMRLSGGSADPKIVNQLLAARTE